MAQGEMPQESQYARNSGSIHGRADADSTAFKRQRGDNRSTLTGNNEQPGFTAGRRPRTAIAAQWEGRCGLRIKILHRIFSEDARTPVLTALL